MAESIIEDANKYIFGRLKKEALKTETCIHCGKKSKGFYDEESKADYAATGICQYCQDRMFSRPAIGEA